MITRLELDVANHPYQSLGESNLSATVAVITQMQNDARCAGAVKARSAAERGGGAKRRSLDGAEHRATIEAVMAAGDSRPMSLDRTVRLRCAHWQVVVLAQRRFSEIRENAVQPIQRHG